MTMSEYMTEHKARKWQQHRPHAANLLQRSWYFENLKQLRTIAKHATVTDCAASQLLNPFAIYTMYNNV